MRTVLLYFAILAIFVGFVNFFWFFAESAAIGGDALNGYEQNGHFFVASHGAYREVTESAWRWSRTHAISVLVTHSLAFVAMAYVLLGYVFPSFFGGRATAEQATDRLRLVRDSGPELASARCSGRVGMVTVSGPLLRVSVRPGGLLIKPLFMPPRVILAAEIRAIVPKGKWGWQRIEIEHDGVDVASPVVLDVTVSSAVATEISFLSRSIANASPAGVPEAAIRQQTVLRVLAMWGLFVNLVMILAGVFWAIPSLGAFGAILTGGAVLIAIVNARGLFRRAR